MGNKKHLPKPDYFVEKLVEDPGAAPHTQLFTGFIGESSEYEHIRLYFDPALIEFIDIPTYAILHFKKISRRHSPLGGYFVWVDPEAQVVERSVGRRRKAKFLCGPVKQKNPQGDSRASYRGSRDPSPYRVIPEPIFQSYFYTAVCCTTTEAPDREAY